jgi:hypothetical protein
MKSTNPIYKVTNTDFVYVSICCLALSSVDLKRIDIECRSLSITLTSSGPKLKSRYSFFPGSKTNII